MTNLFGAAEVATNDAAPIIKRHKLKMNDTVTAKCFDPFGTSVLEEIPLDTLWTLASKGDKYTEFFTELACRDDQFDGKYRVGIGISRLAQVVLEVIQRLTSPYSRSKPRICRRCHGVIPARSKWEKSLWLWAAHLG